MARDEKSVRYIMWLFFITNEILLPEIEASRNMKEICLAANFPINKFVYSASSHYLLIQFFLELTTDT